jgi:uncharacterized protein with HEPN domain
MNRDVSLYLRDILQYMQDAQDFVRGVARERFAADKKTLYATVRAIEVIGEATKNIPEDLRRRHPAVPWKEMAGMRDKLIHAYVGIDIETVWLTVTDRIPALRPLIARVLAEMEERK